MMSSPTHRPGRSGGSGGPGRPAGSGGPRRAHRPARPERFLLPTLIGYDRKRVLPDVAAGVTAGAVVIPQAMAYATIANLPVEIGLYTCMVPMIVYALLGGSRAMSVSTTSTIATLTATTLVTAGVASELDASKGDLVTLTMLVGVFLIIARLFRLGALVENINQATLIGLKVGLGATVALGQVPKLLGVSIDATGSGFIRTINAIVRAAPGTNVATLCLSVGSILALFLLRRFLPRVPGQLVVVAAGILLAAFTALPALGVALIPPVPTGLPMPSLPRFGDLPSLIPGALAIAIMAFLESASVARALRAAGDPPIDSDRELFATGAANLLGSVCNSLPAAGGFSQSAVNQRAGATSQLATLVTAVLAIVVAVVLAPVLGLLPQATLAAMVFVAVVGLIDVRGLLRLARISRVEFWIAIVTAVIGLVAGLLPAVGAGVVLTLILVLRELDRPRITSERPRDGVLVIRLDVPLYTANVRGTLAAATAELQRVDGTHTIVLDLSILGLTSLTVLDSLAEFDHESATGGATLLLAGLPEAAEAMAVRTSWWQGAVASSRVFPSVAAALASVH
ncbi:SulP family inorganic anion transporter [Plantibacter sp. Mn2098]|uniref:SulP family inorganic anion transporter n=1 Tax=Plantibacter sp. Mn2098 TaxID=3395266 RepID=UPI003BC03577